MEVLIAIFGILLAIATIWVTYLQFRTASSIPGNDEMSEYLREVVKNKVLFAAMSHEQELEIKRRDLLRETIGEYNAKPGKYMSPWTSLRKKDRLEGNFKTALASCEDGLDVGDTSIAISSDDRIVRILIAGDSSVSAKRRITGAKTEQRVTKPSLNVSDKKKPSESGLRAKERTSEWNSRIREFGAGYAPSRRRLREGLAQRWVNYAQVHGIDPTQRNESSINAFLDPMAISPSTEREYRRILNHWFNIEGDSSDSDLRASPQEGNGGRSTLDSSKRVDGLEMAHWKDHISDFGAGYARSRRTLRESVARRWIQHAIDHNIDPTQHHTQALERFLEGMDISADTEKEYRRILRQWFESKEE